jgi:RNA polymerase sigma factor (sigma-70 family)
MSGALSITTAMSADRNKNITRIISDTSKRLFDFIRQRVATTEDAEDILQDVFYQLAGNTEDIEQVSSWLFRVTRNKIIDSYRKNKLPLADDIFSDADDEEGFNWREMILSSADTPEKTHIRNKFWQILRSALDELPEEQKTVFIQNEIEGMPFKDIAEETGAQVATLISRKRYAVVHLRKRLSVLKDELLNH